MGSDKNEEQRYEYNVQIAEKERMLDNLQNEQKKAQLIIEHFAERMMASYQRLEFEDHVSDWADENRDVRDGEGICYI